jgi:hypothetical protein
MLQRIGDRTGAFPWAHAFATTIGAMVLIAALVSAGWSEFLWGYVFTPPAPDQRTHEVAWRELGSFNSSASDGPWTIEPQDKLEMYRREEAPDLECCALGPNVGIAEKSTPSHLTQDDLNRIQPEIERLVEFENGEAGYERGRMIHGIVARGTLNDSNVVFAAITGGEVSNDHYPAYNVFYARNPLRLLSLDRYHGDIAGIEGFTAPPMFVLVFLAECATALALLLIRRMVTTPSQNVPASTRH